MVSLAVVQSESAPGQEETFRREAMGAFAHEVRTPLTSIKMVMELARRQSAGKGLLLDDELADMLRTSVDDLQTLADDLQESSRLERGRAKLSRGPSDLAVAVAAAQDLLRGIELAGTIPPGIEGPWDASHLVRAIAGFGESANRIGNGSGVVRLALSTAPGAVELLFRSGEPGGSERPITADAGFSFFRSRQLVLAMGGSVHCQRAERFATFRVALPLGLPGDAP